MEQTVDRPRSTFRHIAPQGDIRPTNRALVWFQHIARHGPQSSVYLHALTRATHRCADTTRRDLQKLRAAGFLSLPQQQRRIERAHCKSYVYDLSVRAKDHLRDHGLDVPSVRPGGPWWHQFLVACTTSSIDIAAQRDGVRYIPAPEILAIKGASLAVPIGRTKLIPDQLFALQYETGVRVCALEVDRGTEPKTSPRARKSLARSIQHYDHLLSSGLAEQHYGLNAPLLVLWLFASKSAETRFRDVLQNLNPESRHRFATQTLSPEQSLAPMSALLEPCYHAPWWAGDGKVFRLGGVSSLMLQG